MINLQDLPLLRLQSSKQYQEIEEQKINDSDSCLDTQYQTDCQSQNNYQDQNENQPNKKVIKLKEINAFPSQEELLYPSYVQSIPLDYKFTNKGEYFRIMSTLEREKFIRPLREALSKHLLRKNNGDTEYPINTKELEVIRNFEVIGTCFKKKEGLLIQVIAERFIPKNKDNQVKGNQLMIIFNKENDQMHLGKVLSKDQNNKTVFDNDDNNGFEEDSESEENVLERTPTKEKLTIQLDIDERIQDLLANINDIENKYFLVQPADYWYSTEISLNCIKSFQKCNKIAFPAETLQAKFKAEFPKYSFLNSEEKIKQYQLSLENTVNKKSKDLDPIQLQAFKHALLNSNSIIQGPPGTGKTFLGCEIVNALLNNYSTLSNKPILVLSKKNKSLDALLLKISQFTNSILRIGSRITIDEIQKYSAKQRKAPNKYIVSPKNSWSDLKEKINKLSKISLKKNQKPQIPDELKKILKKNLVECLCSSLNISINEQEQKKLQQSLFDLWISEKNFTTKRIKKLLGDSKIEIDLSQEYLLNDLLNQQKFSIKNETKFNYEQLVNQINSTDCFSQFNTQFRQMLNQSENMAMIYQIQQRLLAYNKDLDKRKEVSTQIYKSNMSKFMEQFKIIGMTFSGFHMNYEVFSKLNPEIVLVEEASEILETEFFPILSPWLKHLIQIGDHQQLRPIVKSQNLQKHYNLEKSYFERLISINEVDHITLLTQRRMRTEFANITRLFYGYQYSDHNSVQQFKNISQINCNTSMYMLQHTFQESDLGNKSFVNYFEALFATEIANLLVSKWKYNPQKITIICMYNAQCQLVQNLVNSYFNKNNPQVHVSTVDKYQGQENDIVILSCVRSNNNNEIGFLNIDNRINVAFSRARKGFICLGNFLMYEKTSEMWQKINQVAKQQKSFCEKKPFTQYKDLFTKILQTYTYLNQMNCGQCNKQFHLGQC